MDILGTIILGLIIVTGLSISIQNKLKSNSTTIDYQTGRPKPFLLNFFVLISVVLIPVIVLGYILSKSCSGPICFPHPLAIWGVLFYGLGILLTIFSFFVEVSLRKKSRQDLTPGFYKKLTTFFFTGIILIVAFQLMTFKLIMHREERWRNVEAPKEINKISKDDIDRAVNNLLVYVREHEECPDIMESDEVLGNIPYVSFTRSSTLETNDNCGVSYRTMKKSCEYGGELGPFYPSSDYSYHCKIFPKEIKDIVRKKEQL